MLKLMSNTLLVLWLAALAYLGFYAFGLIMGVISPTDQIGLTIVAAVLLAWSTAHAIRVRRALLDEGDPTHDDLMNARRRWREQRGF